MKTICQLLFLAVSFSSFAQWSTSGGLSSTDLTTGGNVGIGVSSPQSKLDVSGDVRIASRLHFTKAEGYTGNSYAIFGLSSQTPGKSFLFYNYDGPVNELMTISGATGNVVINGTVQGRKGIKANQVADGDGFYAHDGVNSMIFSITRQPNNETRFQSYGFHTFYNGNNTGAERMRITTNGNVGIGVTSPSATLHVGNTDASIRIGAVNDPGTLSVPVGAVTKQYNLDFSGYRDSYPDQIGARISALRFNNYSSNQAFIQSTGLAFYTNSKGFSSGTTDLTESMRIMPDGRIGVGTASPSASLHIGNTDAGIRIGAVNDPGLLSVPVGAVTKQYNLDFSGYRDSYPDQIGARISALRFNNYNSNQAFIQSTGLAFYTNSKGFSSGTTDLTESMRIMPDGRIGIGTSNPSQKLEVKGTVYSTEVKVDINAGSGPDYVFEKDYALPSLESVKTYIDQNKHLPEVPSAKEMEANGINLSEMNMLLLKKVEELTLYMIDLKEENKELKTRINKLENKND